MIESRRNRAALCLLLATASLAVTATQATLLNDPANPVQLRTGVEIGFLSVRAHTIQFGTTGTKLDYVREGGQDNLYLFNRLSLEADIVNRHNVTFLYQPIDVRTQALLERDLVVDDLRFPSGTPINLRYGFDFYRISYLYDLVPDPEKELAIGASLQLRNASISFATPSGDSLRINQNVGPVPVLKFRGQWPLGGQSWIGTEIDGFYASDKIFNGANFKFEGSILDASVRYGLQFNESLKGFLNLRYLGGSAKGKGYDTPGPSDGYTDNELNTVSVSLGFYMK